MTDVTAERIISLWQRSPPGDDDVLMMLQTCWKPANPCLAKAGLHGKGCLGRQVVLSDSGDEHRQEVHTVHQRVKLTTLPSGQSCD